MTSLTIKIPPKLKGRLEAEAQFSGKSVSAMIRELVEQRLDFQQKNRPKLSLYERSKDLCGCFRSGVKDLATNAKYLEGLGEWHR